MCYEIALRKVLYLCAEESPDKTPELHTDAEFQGELEFLVHSGQFATIPDIEHELVAVYPSSCQSVSVPRRGRGNSGTPYRRRIPRIGGLSLYSIGDNHDRYTAWGSHRASPECRYTRARPENRLNFELIGTCHVRNGGELSRMDSKFEFSLKFCIGMVFPSLFKLPRSADILWHDKGYNLVQLDHVLCRGMVANWPEWTRNSSFSWISEPVWCSWVSSTFPGRRHTVARRSIDRT